MIIIIIIIYVVIIIIISVCLQVDVLSSKIGFDIILTFEGKQVMKQEITGE